MVIERVREGERRGERKKEEGILVLEAGLVPIRPEARGRFVCTGRASQRRTEAVLMLLLPNRVAMEGISAAVLHSLTPPPFFSVSLLPTLLEQSPNGSSELFTDVLCLCVIHESCSCQSPWTYCPRNRVV